MNPGTGRHPPYNRVVPTYEYVCRDCGTHSEVYQRFSEEPLIVCDVCGGELRKVFHPAGILFKGPGFYATDSRRSASSKTGAGDKGGESTSSDTNASTSSEGATSTPSKAGAGTGTASPSSTKETSA
jgi:putative FmdB family regulatory protein